LPWLASALDLGKALDRTLGIFAEAAGLDAERVRRWTQLLVVQGAFWEHRYGGPGMAWLTTLFEETATLLAE
jgi:streptomycin 6-kinase